MARAPKAKRWRATLFAVLFLASVADLLLLDARVGMHAILHRALSGFIAPGDAIWWLVPGGPFRTGPRGAGGMAFAATANAACWWLLAVASSWCLSFARRKRRSRA